MARALIAKLHLKVRVGTADNLTLLAEPTMSFNPYVWSCLDKLGARDSEYKLSESSLTKIGLTAIGSNGRNMKPAGPLFIFYSPKDSTVNLGDLLNHVAIVRETSYISVLSHFSLLGASLYGMWVFPPLGWISVVYQKVIFPSIAGWAMCKAARGQVVVHGSKQIEDAFHSGCIEIEDQ